MNIIKTIEVSLHGWKQHQIFKIECITKIVEWSFAGEIFAVLVVEPKIYLTPMITQMDQ